MSNESEIRVWQINDEEWWVGAGPAEDVLAAYMNAYGVTHEDATGDVDELPQHVSEAAMGVLIFNDCDENEESIGTCTFREQLAKEVAAGGEFPREFATSNF